MFKAFPVFTLLNLGRLGGLGSATGLPGFFWKESCRKMATWVNVQVSITRMIAAGNVNSDWEFYITIGSRSKRRRGKRGKKNIANIINSNKSNERERERKMKDKAEEN